LHVQQDTIPDPIRNQAVTANVEPIYVVEPQHSCRNLAVEPGGSQDNPDVATEFDLFSAGSCKPIDESCACLVNHCGVNPAEVAFVSGYDVVKRHCRHRRRVPQSLQLEVTAVGGPLQLDHYQVAFSIDTQEVDAPPRAVRYRVLLGDEKDVFC
jgi:hypothetical protein